MKFECHITIDLAHAEYAQQCADIYKWKTSEIERDPILGQASYFYLTSYDTNFIMMVERIYNPFTC